MLDVSLGAHGWSVLNCEGCLGFYHSFCLPVSVSVSGSLCSGLNEKYTTQVHMFEHLVPIPLFGKLTEPLGGRAFFMKEVPHQGGGGGAELGGLIT